MKIKVNTNYGQIIMDMETGEFTEMGGTFSDKFIMAMFNAKGKDFTFDGEKYRVEAI
jgi:hypothetical protein